MIKAKATVNTEVTTVQPQSLVMIQTEVPDYLKDNTTTRGSENVTMEDLVIPRLEIVQGLSPAVKKGDPGYIKGAEAGMLNNSVTRELYGESVMVIPVYFMVQYLVWRDRKMAQNLGISSEGGFFGAFNTEREARERAAAEGGEAKAITIIDTPQHFCLLINQNTGEVSEVMVSMPRTKAKISRQWNSLVKLNGGDRFSRVYALSADYVKNAQGDFYNFRIAAAGFPSLGLFKQAETLYNNISSGERRVVMDVSGLDEGGKTTSVGDDNSEM